MVVESGQGCSLSKVRIYPAQRWGALSARPSAGPPLPSTLLPLFRRLIGPPLPAVAMHTAGGVGLPQLHTRSHLGLFSVAALTMLLWQAVETEPIVDGMLSAEGTCAFSSPSKQTPGWKPLRFQSQPCSWPSQKGVCAYCFSTP